MTDTRQLEMAARLYCSAYQLNFGYQPARIIVTPSQGTDPLSTALSQIQNRADALADLLYDTRLSEAAQQAGLSVWQIAGAPDPDTHARWLQKRLIPLG